MSDSPIALFVKYQRQSAGLTQLQLAERAGVGLRFIRDLEQGKTSVRLDKVNEVLALFGCAVGVRPEERIDPYNILVNYWNRLVTVHLKSGPAKTGVFIEEVRMGKHIYAWKFIPAVHMKEYGKGKDQSLLETINHADIESVQ
ncbi:MAG: transcriptional regulator [Sphingobacteriales bacterium]|nr:MAG: transcriptional regulator [Sphingobacteriales bacterium]